MVQKRDRLGRLDWPVAQLRDAHTPAPLPRAGGENPVVSSFPIGYPVLAQSQAGFAEDSWDAVGFYPV